jgi:hypothetical protein
MVMETGITMFIAGINAFGRQMETNFNKIANVNTKGSNARKSKTQKTIKEFLN